jgi:P4 family phage/plasmid primase-like protien
MNAPDDMPARSAAADPAEMRHALALMFDQDAVVELRAIFQRGKKRTVAGYFDHAHRGELIQHAARLNKAGAAVYVTMNSIDPQLISRYANRVEEYAQATATDANVLRRQWLLLDFDPARPKDTSSSEEQLDLAKEAAFQCAEALSAAGWPDPLSVMSGNGVHLLYRIDLPNDDAGRELVKATLEALAKRFDTHAVKLDQSVFNAGRIVKLPGTVANKGDDVASAPWRTSHILAAPDAVSVVDAEQLRALLPPPASAPPPRSGTPPRNEAFDLEAFLARLGIEFDKDLHGGRERFKLRRCPFNEDHGNGEAAIFRAANGKIGFKCQHNGCADKHWKDVRALVDGPRGRRTTRNENEQTAAPGAPAPDMETEMQLAASFVRKADNKLLYVAGMDWFRETGPRWARDQELVRFSLANNLCRIAGAAADTRSRVRIETHRSAAAVVNIARPGLIALPGDFDCVPTDLNTPAGVIDLRSGTMRRRNRDDRYMHCTEVPPDARGISGTAFSGFLSAITCCDTDLTGFIQRMLGACLFASSAREDHWLAFLVGEGRNGKGTLIEKCASRAMGTYARRIPAEVLLADDRGTRHPTEIANLVGARLAYASEIDEGRRWNESRLKELSGGDKLSGRFMRQDLFEFVPSHRLVIYANHRPLIQNPDTAFRARLKLVPFAASFVGREDTGLPDTLRAELPIILRWMIDGAAEYWNAGRLVDCPAVAAASAAYFDLHATFDAWIAERCYVGPAREERAKALYADFKRWKEDRGEGVPSQTRWGESMGRRFQRRQSNGIIWCGISLRP